MSPQPWSAFVQILHADCRSNPASLDKELPRFTEFVSRLPQAERVPLLLHAYDRYRELSACSVGNGQAPVQRFESSCHSILISTILAGKIQPDEVQALEILRKSYHQCGHGSDVEPPLALAERAFDNRPYSLAFFDAVVAYRETLRGTRSTSASNLKRKLNWVLWHDPRHLEKKCCTRRIQLAIQSMEPGAVFHWQWLLRNTAPGLNSAPGIAWSKEAKKRLARIGDDEFLRRIEDWLTFSDPETYLSAPGSAMLRLLVWYASLVDVERSLPIVTRLAHVSWVKREPALKVVSALAWLLGKLDRREFDTEVRILCDQWAGESAEINRLQEAFFPADAASRREGEREASKQIRKELDAQLAGFSVKLNDLFSSAGMPESLASLLARHRNAGGAGEPKARTGITLVEQSPTP